MFTQQDFPVFDVLERTEPRFKVIYEVRVLKYCRKMQWLKHMNVAEVNTSRDSAYANKQRLFRDKK